VTKEGLTVLTYWLVIQVTLKVTAMLFATLVLPNLKSLFVKL
jgi:hypothetical protein